MICDQFVGAAILLAIGVPALGVILFKFLRWVEVCDRLARLATTQSKHDHAVAACLFTLGPSVRSTLLGDRHIGSSGDVDGSLLRLCTLGLVARMTETGDPSKGTPWFELTPEGETVLGEGPP